MKKKLLLNTIKIKSFITVITDNGKMNKGGLTKEITSYVDLNTNGYTNINCTVNVNSHNHSSCCVGTATSAVNVGISSICSNLQCTVICTITVIC